MFLVSFFLNDTAPTGIYTYGHTLSLHAALPISNRNSLTADYLNGARQIPRPAKRRKGSGKKLTVHNARANNLQNVTASIPLGTFTCITGVSGSGKSSFTIDTLYAASARALNGARLIAGAHDKVTRSEEHTSELQSIMRL